MADKQATQEQIKEFWEWCGFKFFRPIEEGAIDVIYPDGSTCLSPSKLAYPPIDLNNLFKYAVPLVGKQLKDDQRFLMLLKNWITDVFNGEDPALALFWALRHIEEAKAKG